MTKDGDELEQKVDLLLENLALKEQQQKLEAEVERLQREKTSLEKIIKKNTPSVERVIEKYKKRMDKDCFQEELTPIEINEFLQAAAKHPSLDCIPLLNRLISNSYRAGHNNFILTTRSLPEALDYVGFELQGGGIQEYLQITIQGDVGDNCGNNSQSVSIIIEGNAKNHLGQRSKNSLYKVGGNAGSQCGEHAENIKVIITGNVGNRLGDWAKSSSFKVKGNVGDDCGYFSQDSSFYVKGNCGSCELGGEDSSFNIRGKVYGSDHRGAFDRHRKTIERAVVALSGLAAGYYFLTR